MVVCRFWQQGNCKFGDNCKNEHPGSRTEANRYAPLSNGYGNGPRSRAGGVSGGDRYRPGDNKDQKLPYNLDPESIISDLTTGGAKGERPVWPLSVYGPGRDAPRQLLEGAVEQSFEEMRLLCYEAKAKNQLEQYTQHEAALSAQIQQQIQGILNNLDGAIKYVIDGEQQHPNRLDQVVKNSGTFSKPATGGFSQPSGPSPLGGNTTFGQPSNMPQSTSTFGQPSQPSGGFGQPSDLGGARPAFGQPSRPAAGGFGQPSNLGGAKPSFGQPSQPAAGGFGQPSNIGGNKPAFGQPSQPSFGQPSQPAFGQPSQSTFGQPSQPAFGQPSQPAFGQPSQPAFGQPSQQANSSPFGGGLAQANKPSPFAAAATQPSPFGQSSQDPAQPQANPFGSTGGQNSGNNNAAASPFAPKAPGSTFGAPSQPGNGTFGAPSQPNVSPFAQSTPANGSPFAPRSTFGAPSQPTPGTLGAPSQPASSPFAQSAHVNSGTNTLSGSGFGQPSQPVSTTNGGFGTSNGVNAANGTQPSAAPQTNGATGIQATSSYTTRGRDGKLLLTWKGNKVNFQMDDNNKPYSPSYTNSKTGKEEKIWLPDGPPDRPNPSAEAAPEFYEGDMAALLKQVYDMVREKEEFDDIVPELPPKREWVRWDL